MCESNEDWGSKQNVLDPPDIFLNRTVPVLQWHLGIINKSSTSTSTGSIYNIFLYKIYTGSQYVPNVTTVLSRRRIGSGSSFVEDQIRIR